MMGEKQMGLCPACASNNTIEFNCDKAHIIHAEDVPEHRNIMYYEGTCAHCGCTVREMYSFTYMTTEAVVDFDSMGEMP